MISLLQQPMHILGATKETPDGHEAFFALLHLVTDPAASKKRLEEIFNACLQANDTIREANEARQKLDAARKEHDQTIRQERTEHSQKITQAIADLSSKDRQLNSQLAERERAVKTLETKAAADAAAVAKLRADLERRLATIREAAAS
jgi:SMC interacting uncharacterized protein involved in chromosome segregation